MDELDRGIVELLQLDGRASNAKVAREVGVSEATVRRRLSRLVQQDVIRITAVPNLEKLGYGTTALIRVQTSPGKSDAVAQALATLEEVKYSVVTTGSYAVFIWVVAGSVERLGMLLHTRIGSIDRVQKTQTFVNVSIRKRAYERVLWMRSHYPGPPLLEGGRFGG